MNNINYFKQQLKNLQKDFETRRLREESKSLFFNPKFFDIEKIFTDFNLPFKNFDFPLMKAQHTVAKLAVFFNWNDLIHSSETELKTAKNIFSNSKYKLQKSDFEIKKRKNSPSAKRFLCIYSSTI